MIRLVFMIEELSLKVVLDNVLPSILPENFYPIIIPHDGKSDLEKSIPRKIRAWKDTDTTKYIFIILRDQDSGNCIQIKDKLKNICQNNGRNDALIRIVCRSLESWFLGDLNAIEKACNIPNLGSQQRKKKYRNPDSLGNPEEVINKIFNNNYRKVAHAREISAHLDIQNNKSHSFNVFISGLQKIINEIDL